MEFVFAYLECFVVGAGALGTGIFLVLKKRPRRDNDVTAYLVKINRQNKMISERSKSII